MEILKMQYSDLLKIQNILTTDFDDFWNFNIFASELQNKNSSYFVAKSETSEIIGFAGVLNDGFDMHITNIVTKKNKRKNGTASKLLEKLIKFAKENKSNSLTLEVNENNIPAIKLYEKYKFKKIGIRKHYYSQNENAIIMTLYF
ncbi:MAG: ribosomal protein S18-alanine N-acetyltransferase [Bacilli bacterium]|nr:ribosomal protein S18-alanine N-acetyltransferase [Bacilli bacterium]